MKRTSCGCPELLELLELLWVAENADRESPEALAQGAGCRQRYLGSDGLNPEPAINASYSPVADILILFLAKRFFYGVYRDVAPIAGFGG